MQMKSSITAQPSECHQCLHPETTDAANCITHYTV